MKEITGFVILLVSLAAGGPAQRPLPQPGPARPSLSPTGTPPPLPLTMDLGPPLFPGSPSANGLGWRHWAAVGMKNHCLGLPPPNLSETTQGGLRALCGTRSPSSSCTPLATLVWRQYFSFYGFYHLTVSSESLST